METMLPAVKRLDEYYREIENKAAKLDKPAQKRTPPGRVARVRRPSRPSGLGKITDPRRRSQILRGMIRARSVTPGQFAALSHSLREYPLENLSRLREAGVKIHVARAGTMPDDVRGQYNRSKKFVIFHPQIFHLLQTGESAREHVVRTEFGHALDDLRIA